MAEPLGLGHPDLTLTYEYGFSARGIERGLELGLGYGRAGADKFLKRLELAGLELP